MPDEAPNVGEAVEQISGLLQGTPAETPEPTPPVETPAEPAELVKPEPPQELTPASLAETLGLKPADVYSKLRIPVDGGDAMTLGEFKDAGVELRGIRAAQSELAEAKIAHENGVMLQRQTMQRALAKIPEGALTQEMVQEVQREHSAHVQTERHELLQIRPDLQSPGKWDTTRLLLIDHLKPYGFRAIEVDGIIDHRMAKYVIDNAEREQRMKAIDVNSVETPASAKLQAPSKEPAKTSRRATKTTTAKVGVPRTNADKASEVAVLLGATK